MVDKVLYFSIMYLSLKYYSSTVTNEKKNHLRLLCLVNNYIVRRVYLQDAKVVYENCIKCNGW